MKTFPLTGEDALRDADESARLCTDWYSYGTSQVILGSTCCWVSGLMTPRVLPDAGDGSSGPWMDGCDTASLGW